MKKHIEIRKILDLERQDWYSDLENYGCLVELVEIPTMEARRRGSSNVGFGRTEIEAAKNIDAPFIDGFSVRKKIEADALGIGMGFYGESPVPKRQGQK